MKLPLRGEVGPAAETSSHLTENRRKTRPDLRDQPQPAMPCDRDTAYKVSQLRAELLYPILCVGIPKTIDNDLPITDCSPGFGSVAKYVATSLRGAALDVAAMSRTSTKVFTLE